MRRIRSETLAPQGSAGVRFYGHWEALRGHAPTVGTCDTRPTVVAPIRAPSGLCGSLHVGAGLRARSGAV